MDCQAGYAAEEGVHMNNVLCCIHCINWVHVHFVLKKTLVDKILYSFILKNEIQEMIT